MIAASIAAVASVTGAIVNYVNQSRAFREGRRRFEEQAAAQQRKFKEQAVEQREQLELQATEQRDQLALQAREQRDQLELQLGTMREGQLTERFTRAVDQLGSDKPDVRVGGIYALEQIAIASHRDRTAIVEILSTYVQTHAPWPPSRRGQARQGAGRDEVLPLRVWAPDVQAAITVLGRRAATPREQPLDISAVDLRRAELSGADLRNALIYRSCLQRAILSHANLEGVNFARTVLEAADLRDANLDKAILRRADLKEADLGGAGLREANLEFGDLRRAILGGADLRGAVLGEVRLEGARDSTTTKWPEGFDPAVHGVVPR